MTGNYHFIGVGGIGMSALARLALHAGATVSGSDQTGSHLLDELRNLGASVYVGHDASHVPDRATVVISDAIRCDNPELAAARAGGLRIIRRSELLGEMMEQHQGIAVSGTHGKTTTTAMIARILLDNGMDPTVVVGGEAFGPEGNAHAGKGRFFLAEACEAYGSFLHLSPAVAVVTNIEPDHLDFHGGFANIQASFRTFAARIAEGGLLIVNADDPEAALLPAGDGVRRVTYGMQSGDWTARVTGHTSFGSRFVVEHGGEVAAEVTLPVPGEHNVSNSLAAFVVGVELGIDPEDIAIALGRYHGVGRRFEYLGARDGVRVYDDYAHHPTEVRATLAAAREVLEGRVFAVFQPHLYSRTRDFMEEFIASFDDADSVVITGIFKSREEPIPGVTASTMADGIRRRSPGKDVNYIEDKDDVPSFLRSRVREGDSVIFMGAGNIRTAAEAFLAEAPVAGVAG